jgi:DNA-binding NarL/FixJ family response regulator
MGASVLIVDDHSGFRSHARRLLEAEGYEVVGEAEDCASGLEAARDLRPDLALVDVYLPDGDGVELASRLHTLAHPPEIVLTSSREGDELEALLPECGACGFVPKAELCRETIEERRP